MSTHTTITTEQGVVDYSMSHLDDTYDKTITNFVNLLAQSAQWTESDTITFLKTEFFNVTDWSI